MRRTPFRPLALAMLLALLAACGQQAAPPTAAPTTVPEPAAAVNIEARITNAMTAAPKSISGAARIVDWPASAGGGLVELRAGANGWTCIPDDPSTPTSNDPMCLDKQWVIWLEAFIAGTDPQITAPGMSYMLQGGAAASNDDPAVMAPPDGQDWQIDPPHVMLVFPEPLDPATFTRDHHSGGPWVMFGGTPYEHIMFPVTLDPPRKLDDKVANAMSAAPMSISGAARIVDWPTEAGGGLVELRAGTNGWTCIPDDPSTPTSNDPMCLDKQWVIWLEAFIAGTDPQVTAPGMAYMLQGGAAASNDDPAVMAPPAGQDWQIDPPHVMLVFPEPLDPATFTRDHHSGGPWVMFGGTPYEHIMFPVQ